MNDNRKLNQLKKYYKKAEIWYRKNIEMRPEVSLRFYVGLVIVNSIIIGYMGVWRISAVITEQMRIVEEQTYAQRELENKLEVLTTISENEGSIIDIDYKLNRDLPETPETHKYLASIVKSVGNEGFVLNRMSSGSTDNNTTYMTLQFIGDIYEADRLISTIESLDRITNVTSVTLSKNRDISTISVNLEIYQDIK